MCKVAGILLGQLQPQAMLIFHNLSQLKKLKTISLVAVVLKSYQQKKRFSK
jgi:hypothetical protein